MAELSPIVLFVYNRPWHTQQTIEALQKNTLAADSEIFIYSDAPKNDDAISGVDDVRNVIRKIEGFKKVQIIEREKNYGLANSIIGGVSDIVNQYGKVIVLEDDMLTSKYFLQYMNEALKLYKDSESVVSVHGYIYPTKEELPETFFIKGADCWGWATWKRGWDLFEKDGSKLLKELKKRNLTRTFDLDDAYPYTQMLEDQIQGKNNSWAIRWYASAFLADRLTLYPGKSLVQNIGIDGSGTHCSATNDFDVELSSRRILLKQIPLQENKQARKIIVRALKPKTGFFTKLKRKIRERKARKQRKIEQYGWFRTDLSWQEVKQSTSGYDTNNILEKCKNALLKVKNHEAEYERDSVIFDEIEYSWPLLAGILLVAAKNNGKINLIDFGGSLGSSYFQNRKFLTQLDEVKWNIVEQANFVACGKEYFADSRIQFYETIDECVKGNQINAFLISSTLQYLEKPYEFLEQLLCYDFEYLIFDLTGFFDGDEDILTIQKVWPEVYSASYPCWFFSETKLFDRLVQKYTIIEKFHCELGKRIAIDGTPQAQYLGAILQIKK